MVPVLDAPQRRTLRFETLDDLLADARSLAGGPIRTTGNWTAGQIIGHVAIVIDGSIDGYHFKLPWPARVYHRFMILNRALREGIPPGIKIHENARGQFIPPADLTLSDAIEHLTRSVQRAEQRGMHAADPHFGKLTHEQWVQMHCRHAELHFGFIHPDNP